MKSVLLVIMQFLMIFFDDWSFFESEHDDDTSQEAMANNEHPVKEGVYCKMCHESSMS